MKYKILIRLLAIFMLIMLTVTMTAIRIRDFTSPTVQVMPLQEEIPNTAFINGSDELYILMDRTSIFDKEQYIARMAVQKVKANDLTTIVNYVYNLNAYIVIASDRPLRDNIRVKTAGRYDIALIKSKYRDVISIQTNMDYDGDQIIDRIKKASPLILDIWYQIETSDQPFTTIYVKAKQGCSQILENQLNTLLGNVGRADIINIELKFLKLDFAIWMYFCLILMILFMCSLSKLKKCYGKLKRAIHREKRVYYIKDIIERNLSAIILMVLYAVAVCFSYFMFFKFLPLPPIPAELIPEKLIYIRRLVDSVSEYNKMLDKHRLGEPDLFNHLDITYQSLWIGLFALIGVAIILLAITKTRKSRRQALVKKGKSDNE